MKPGDTAIRWAGTEWHVYSHGAWRPVRKSLEDIGERAVLQARITRLEEALREIADGEFVRDFNDAVDRARCVLEPDPTPGE